MNKLTDLDVLKIVGKMCSVDFDSLLQTIITDYKIILLKKNSFFEFFFMRIPILLSPWLTSSEIIDLLYLVFLPFKV